MSHSFTFHEQLYRTQELLLKLRETQVTVCGAGALGANLIETLARIGFRKLRVIDFDRVEERNLSSQPYYRSDIGAHKVKILANSLFRALGVQLDSVTDRLTTDNARKLLQGSQIVVDTFDNSVSRAAVKQACEVYGIACLHAGMASDFAEITWNEQYRVPSATQDDVCDYPLARNLVMLTVAVTSETLIHFIENQEKNGFMITLRDLNVRQV